MCIYYNILHGTINLGLILGFLILFTFIDFTTVDLGSILYTTWTRGCQGGDDEDLSASCRY